MKKRAVALFLSVLLLFTLCPTVFAEDVPTSGKCGDNLTWRYDEGTKTLTVSGTGPMDDYGADYSYDYTPWFDLQHEEAIRSVVIEPGVTSIGNGAFQWCEALTSVTIPDTVTSIEDGAFYFCTALPTVTIPQSVTNIGIDAFSICKNLTSINVDAANKNYTSVDGVLFSKDMMVLYKHPGGKSGSYQVPSGVTSIAENAFAVCESLTSVTIPESVTSIGEGAFAECSSLTSVTIPGGVTSIGAYTLELCESLTSVTIPASVTSIGGFAFYDCDALKDVYYGGSESQWAQIDIDNSQYGNYSLTKAAIHYNSGAADPKPSTGFTDVPANAYYANAVKWAVENKITTGATATTFDPNGNCTRAQIVTFLWRAYGEQEPQSMVSPFSDVTDPNAYYYKAVLWAVEKKITTGATAATFDPNGTCTRGQAVTFQWRAADKPPASGGKTFGDVADGAFYADAVKWAVENKITTGATATTFDPNGTCTRGQIVTFLYRDLA